MCGSCYHSGDGDNGNVVHAHHPFVMSEELGGLEESVERNILLVEPVSGDWTKSTLSHVPDTSGSQDDEGGNENRAPSASSSTKPKTLKRRTSNGRNPSSHQSRTARTPPPALPSTSLSVSSSLRIQRRDSTSSNNENTKSGRKNDTTNQLHGNGKLSLSLRRKPSTSKQSAPSPTHLPDVVGLVAVGTSLK